MPPRLKIYGIARSLSIRTSPLSASCNPINLRLATRRGIADGKEPNPGSNQDVLGSVSDEAADLGRVTGETQPDLSRGTPAQEILERDEESRKKAPEVIKEEIDGTESVADATSFENLFALGQLEAISEGGNASDVLDSGHKFGLPSLPLPPNMHLRHRYDPLVEQVTKLLMRHGKLSVAQRNMSVILNHLRTAPPPNPNPARPLLPGAPPARHLPLNPVLYLTLAIDSVAPLLRIRSQRGAAGGGAALQIPVPLGLRQRRRTAFQWILNAVDKKKSRGSGRGQFAQRVAEEIISIVEGKSPAWEKRALVHKTATGARANIAYFQRMRR